MPSSRRSFLLSAAIACGAALTACSSRRRANVAARPSARIRAVAFDAFAIFDPSPSKARLEALYPGRGAELASLWRTRQFEYAWLRALGGRYVDFEQVSSDALAFAARSAKLELDEARRSELVRGLSTLPPWPDALGALRRLRASGLRLAPLSNFTPSMLRGCVEAAGMSDLFEALLSTDRAKAYKPEPRAYELGPRALGLAREEIAFAAFAGWDAAGASWFGYPTYWVNRAAAPPEELGAATAIVVRDLDELADHLVQNR